MKQAYTFNILRFICDPLTQEFVNVGIVIFFPEERRIVSRCIQHYSRISKMFGMSVDGPRLRQTLKFIQDRINSLGDEFNSSLHFEKDIQVERFLARVLPVDDSALQFHPGGAGISSDVDVTIERLFYTYVDRYSSVPTETKREDEDVWRTFKGEFERKQIIKCFEPKRITAQDFEYEFQHSWKNGRWNVLEPLSFDLLTADSILDKANRWVGRATGLQDSHEDFKLYLLLGAPTETRLRDAYHKAANLLNKMPVKHDFVKEDEAASFAATFADEIAHHNA